MLKILDMFDDQAIAAFTKLNSMNLARLLSRSIRNKIVSGIALTISVIGLVINIQDVFALSIKDSIDWLSRFNLSSLFLLMIVLLTVFAVLIAGINWVFTTPRIGLVDAYGDIL